MHVWAIIGTPTERRFVGGPMMARLTWYLDPLSPHQLKMFIKQEVKFAPPMTKRSVSVRVKDCAILEPYVQTDESPLEFNPLWQKSN